MVALIQKPAPDFAGPAVVDGLFEDISLKDYAGKWVVLFFYPMDFTFVCPTEILAFSDAIPAFKAINTEVIGESTKIVITLLIAYCVTRIAFFVFFFSLRSC